MAAFEAILFDFDGVLVDSEPLHYECWCEVLSPHGVTLSWENYAKNCIGVSDRAMIRMLCQLVDRPQLFDEIWPQYPRKKAIFRERMVKDVPMPTSTKELLHSLTGYRTAVVSSSGRAEIEPALETAGVRHLFEMVVTGEDVTHLKPSPEPYQTAASRLGVESALVIEDSDAGVQSGLAAGFEVLRVPSAHEMSRLLLERLNRG